VHGIAIGRPVDLIVDPDGRILGVDVLCRDEQHRFLPLAAAEVLDDEIRVDSALTLLEHRELAFYRERGRALAGLLRLPGAPRRQAGRAVARRRRGGMAERSRRCSSARTARAGGSPSGLTCASATAGAGAPAA